MSEKFDVIVVGAGPAGCAAALKLARENVNVLVIERGTYAGSKNMMGGVLYSKVLNDLIPNFWEEAPVERHVTNNALSFLTEDSALNIEYRNERKFGSPPYNSFTVLRAKFDKWFAEKVENEGVMIATNIRVDDLIKENGMVKGIIAGPDKIEADIVIAADGVNSILAQKAGLRTDLKPIEVGLGIKEVLELPEEVINERFNQEGDEGTAHHFVGAFTMGVQGGGFIYTNKESLSIGVVVNLESLIKRKVESYVLIENFKRHPFIMKLIK